MFTPCSNIASAARQIAQLVEVCRTSTRSKGDPGMPQQIEVRAVHEVAAAAA
jgi:hypothetical protein